MKKKIRNMVIIWGILIGFFVLLIFGNNIIGLIGYSFTYSTGERAGQVVKLSEKGLIWKTQEGGLAITQSGAYIDYWNFSLDEKDPNKEELLNKLRTALKNGGIVNISYKQHVGVRPWRSSTSYTITNVNQK